MSENEMSTVVGFEVSYTYENVLLSALDVWRSCQRAMVFTDLLTETTIGSFGRRKRGYFLGCQLWTILEILKSNIH